MNNRRSILCRTVLAAVLVAYASIHVDAAHRVEPSAVFRPHSRLSSLKVLPQTVPTTTAGRPKEALALRGGVANTLPNAFVASIVMALIEKGVKEGLKAANVKFPAQLGGCIFLFSFMMLAEKINPELGNAIFEALSPGAGILAKWLPVFFVPGLALLPLSPKIGTSVDVAKVIMVCCLGFVYTVTTTVASVLTALKVQGTPVKVASVAQTKKTATATPAKKPFSDATMGFFIKGTFITAVLSLLATKMNNDFSSPLQTAFLGFFTFAAYVWGARLPTGFVKVIHPLVTSSILVLGLMQALARINGQDFLDVVRSYKVGSLYPMKAGAGDILLYLLGPSVVSFAISMYSRRDLLKSNLLVVLTAMFVSSAGGLFGTAAFVRLINLGGRGGRMVRLSVLARNITTALSMALTAMLGGDISVAASVVVLTGIIGATYGKALLALLNISDPIVRGLAIGSSSQGLGVAAISDEPDAFPFAAISMVLTAISATTLVSIPAVRAALIRTAVGN
jgi:putative effector of murein hydrolase